MYSSTTNFPFNDILCDFADCPIDGATTRMSNRCTIDNYLSQDLFS